MLHGSWCKSTFHEPRYHLLGHHITTIIPIKDTNVLIYQPAHSHCPIGPWRPFSSRSTDLDTGVDSQCIGESTGPHLPCFLG